MLTWANRSDGLTLWFFVFKKKEAVKKIRKKNTISPTQSFFFTCEKEMDKIQREKNRKVEEGV